MSAHTSYVHLGSHRLRVRVSGSGPPLLLVMGIGGNLEMWQPLSDALPGRELITFDCPGTGGSSTPRLPILMRQQAAVAARLLRMLGYRSVDVLGVSWGGVVAQQLAIARPSRVRRLVLASTVPGVIAVPGSPAVLRRMLTPRRYYSRAYFESVAPTIYGGRARYDLEYLQRETQVRLARPPSMRGYLGQMLAISTFTSLPRLHRITAPTLVLSGDDDPLVPIVNARLLARRIPDATLHVVEGGGHLILLDSTDEVAPVIAAFLDAPGRENPGDRAPEGDDRAGQGPGGS